MSRDVLTGDHSHGDARLQEVKVWKGKANDANALTDKVEKMSKLKAETEKFKARVETSSKESK